MAVLILAPVLKVLEEGVDLVVGVALQVPVDADVPPVANLHMHASRVTSFRQQLLCHLHTMADVLQLP